MALDVRDGLPGIRLVRHSLSDRPSRRAGRRSSQQGLTGASSSLYAVYTSVQGAMKP
jgi:hypothetical protein